MQNLITLHIDHPGLYSTLQDTGRAGHQAQGVPVGGALDRDAAWLANRLVGNEPEEPVLEMTLQGPVIRLAQETQLALTGADLSPTLNGAPLPMYESVRVQAGSELRFGRRRSGCRAYLAVRGSWQAQRWLDSVSPPPYRAEALTPDSLLKKGSVIKVEPRGFLPRRIYPDYARPDLTAPHYCRLLPGPEYEQFSGEFKEWFFARQHRVSADSNRMGYRLQEAYDGLVWTEELISSAVLPGTVQVTRSGQPIVLLSDAQTTGGYPRLGIVPERERSRLAQVCPGEWVRFGI